MKTYKIPLQFIGYPEGTKPPTIDADAFTYCPNGDLVLVTLWERYPDYDFIFGVPAMESEKYAKEICFFQFRRKDGVNHGHYFDILETDAMIRGFTRAFEISKENSPHLWQKSPLKM